VEKCERIYQCKTLQKGNNVKVFSKEEINQLVEDGRTGDYHLVIHTQDFVKFAHAIAYNAQTGGVSGLSPLSEIWRQAIDKHLVKVFSSYLREEKIHIIKSRDEDA
jgi:hypothetical protein